MRHILLTILAFFMTLTIGVGAEPVRIDHNTGKINICPHFSVLEDATGSLALYDVLPDDMLWKDNSRPFFNRGYTQSVFWFKVEVESQLDEPAPYYLEIAFPTLDHVDLYLPDDKGGFTVAKAGDMLPFRAKKVRHRNIIFPISVSPGPQSFYLKVRSQGAMEFHAYLMTPAAHLETSTWETSIIWLLYGCMLMVALYNASVFLITRDRAYLHLVCYTVSIVVLHFTHLGHSHQYLWPNSVSWNYTAMLISLGLNLTFAGSFTASFLETKQNHPFIHKVLFYFMTLAGLVYIVLVPFVNFQVAVQYQLKHNGLACIFLILMLIYLVAKKERAAVFLLIGFSIILVSGAASIGAHLGYLPPSFLSKWVLLIGAAWLMLTFSVGLADKINILRRNLEDSEEHIRAKNLELMESNDELSMINKAMEERNEELQNLHEALEASEQRFRSIIEQSPMVIELYDPEGNLVQTNKIQKDTWGEYGPMSGAEFNILNSPNIDKLPIAERLKKAFRGEGAFVEEWSLNAGVNTGETRRRYYRSRMYPVKTAQGKFKNVVIMHEDITMDRQAEEILIQSEKMVSLGGLAAGMAHEISNPLAGMVQNAQVVLRRLTEDLPANREAANRIGMDLNDIFRYMDERGIASTLEVIRESGNRASTIIQNMLSFSRKDSSVALLCDLNQLLRQTLDLARNDYDLKMRYNFRNVRVEEDFDPDTPKVLCEPSKLQQVFLNILKNGAQAMATQATKQDPCFTLRTRPEGENVVVEIQDNGPGMDEDTLNRIFEPFFTTKGTGEGTGLGLYLSGYIVKNIHGGTIRATSTLNQGTRFIVTLPAEGN